VNKFEARRLALADLINRFGRGGVARVAEVIGKDASYVSRMLYEVGKPGKKRIGEESWDVLLLKFPEIAKSPWVSELGQVTLREDRARYTAWDAYDQASSTTRAAVDVLLLPPTERHEAIKRWAGLVAAVELIERHALEAINARKSPKTVASETRMVGR